jgi:hypothetical protein
MMTAICAAEKARKQAARRVRFEMGGHEEEDGATVDPGLDDEPLAAGEQTDDGRDAWDMCAVDTEGGAREHQDWQPVCGCWRGREDKSDDDDEVGKGHGGDALEGGHVAEVHEAVREVVGRHADDEAGP